MPYLKSWLAVRNVWSFEPRPERLKIRHMGTFSQKFEIGLRGVDLAGLPCAPVPAKNLTATLAKKDDETFTLTITIEKTTEDAGRGLAEWAAQVFFESIINQFARNKRGRECLF